MLGLSPASGSVKGGTLVTISGPNLADAIAVKFGSLPAKKIVSRSATQIVAVSPAGKAGTVDVKVTTAQGTSSVTAADEFTYAVRPAVTGLSLNSDPLAGGISLVITGSNLANASAVLFGKTPTTIISDTGTQLMVFVPTVAKAGTVYVTVVTPGGTCPTSSKGKFTYLPLPSINRVSPATGPATGGSKVTISGAALANVTAVDFGGTPAKILSNSSKKIVVVAPSGTAGSVAITVTTAGGESAPSTAEFTYVAPAAKPVSAAAGIANAAQPASSATASVRARLTSRLRLRTLCHPRAPRWRFGLVFAAPRRPK